MAVLERSELEASPLADLHAIADQLGLDGFRRLRKPDLIDAILGDSEEQQERPAAAEADELGRRRDAVRGEGRAGRRAGRSARPRARRAAASARGGASERDDAEGGGEQDSAAAGAEEAPGVGVEGGGEVLGNGSGRLRVAPPAPPPQGGSPPPPPGRPS